MELTNDRDCICINTSTGPQNCGTSLSRDVIKDVFKARRYAMKDRNPDDRVVFKCIQSKANVEIEVYG